MLLPPQENAPLFGGRAIAPQPPGSGGAGQAGASLLSENRRLGLSLPLPRTHASVFHAGVIGQGLQQKLPTKRVSKVRLGVPPSCTLVLITLVSDGCRCSKAFLFFLFFLEINILLLLLVQFDDMLLA